ncbi:translation factor GTPase family protein [uncultured Dubosiella sp.]|uniref:translation factor GTPase family protein n=1 Tax=uncultured Dubosiella sp. TaxID=1937011 RepID=UPI0025D0259B|nr:TetM/TetW/TetO/TetS family tetracycline resistance ribosomal protection protein [uncultured Dubosiella sp.]
MKKITIGILAHVDAGKTTCIESMLYTSHEIKKAGRVDHQDSMLDYDVQERERGITIYSKQTRFQWNGCEIYVIDTPGHIDFSTEMERSLQVLDLAILLINAQDGVQAHTETIWECLTRYHIPTIIFVNKMDISFRTQDELMADLEKKLSDNCVDMDGADHEEKLAMVNDEMLNAYSEKGTIPLSLLQESLYKREWFPVYFGSALKHEGIAALLDAVTDLAFDREYPDEFGARVFKINEDGIVMVKITGGMLRPKDVVNDEKIDQIRSYSGEKYTLLHQAQAGDVVGLKGNLSMRTGQGLGFEKDQQESLLSACLEYDLLLPAGTDALMLWPYCEKLAREDPQLQLTYHEHSKTISLSLMGEVQKEILQKKIEEQTGIHVGFTQGKVVFRETIENEEYGVGHFEPLRHYAEVHVLLDPLPAGSGIRIVNENRIENLSLGWQQQIMNALHYRHRGVLTGSELTDVKICFIAARGNQKHTSAQDFSQAARRAVRQALRKGRSILLEPYYEFEIGTPAGSLSRVLYELDQMKADFEISSSEDDMTIIRGKGAVRLFMNFQSSLYALTKGRGRFIPRSISYGACREQAQIVEQSGYDPDSDLRNPTGSVFCAQGSGYYVPYDEVEEHMHLHPLEIENTTTYKAVRYTINDEEAKRVFEMTSGRNQNEKKKVIPHKKVKADLSFEEVKIEPKKPQCLIVDGYNMIYSWSSLKDLARVDYDAARERLIDALSNYQGYKGIEVYVVFDAYRRAENPGVRNEIRGKLNIVFTKYGQTADSYIERLVHDLKKKYSLIVATSDGLIQNAILAQGATRLSARELEGRVMRTNTLAFGHMNNPF